MHEPRKEYLDSIPIEGLLEDVLDEKVESVKVKMDGKVFVITAVYKT